MSDLLPIRMLFIGQLRVTYPNPVVLFNDKIFLDVSYNLEVEELVYRLANLLSDLRFPWQLSRFLIHTNFESREMSYR